jgi:putative isomerase
MDQGDTDPFYIWAAMLPLMATGEIVEFDPWTGWTICNIGQDIALGPMVSPSGTLSLTVETGNLALTLNGRATLRTDLRTTLSRITIAEGRFACTIAPATKGGFIELPAVDIHSVIAARLDGANAGFVASHGGIRLMIAESADDRLLDVYFSPCQRLSAQGSA